MLSCAITQRAYAKINLHLAVLCRRADGYHELASLFQLISLHDTVHVAVTEGTGFSCSVKGVEDICTEGKDTMSKAAALWCDATGFTGSVLIVCEKRIPIQAGLGGGSSDAAAVLRALNLLLPDKALGTEGLREVGGMVGSDVPFFLCGGTAAWGRGRGELLEVIATPAEYGVLVVMPRSFSVSTGRAFTALDDLRLTVPAPEVAAEDVVSMANVVRQYAGDCVGWPFFNDFSRVVGHDEFYSVLDTACRATGNSFGSLSGSGAAWYAVSLDNNALNAIERAVTSEFGDGVCTFRAKMLCNQLCDVTL